MGFAMEGDREGGAGEVGFAHESDVILGKVPAGPLVSECQEEHGYTLYGGGFVALCGPFHDASVLFHTT